MKGLGIGPSLMKYSSGSGMNSNASPIKNFFAKRNSKQELLANKKFGGSRGKTPKIGKKFAGNIKSSSISPSTEEFDNMLSNASGSSSNFSKKKSMFSKT